MELHIPGVRINMSGTVCNIHQNLKLVIALTNWQVRYAIVSVLSLIN